MLGRNDSFSFLLCVSSSISFQAQAHSYCFLNAFSLNSRLRCGSEGNRGSPRHGFISVHMLLMPNLLIFRLIRHSVSANGQRASQEHLCLSPRTEAKGAHTPFIQHILHTFTVICVTEDSPSVPVIVHFKQQNVFFLTPSNHSFFASDSWHLSPLIPPHLKLLRRLFKCSLQIYKVGFGMSGQVTLRLPSDQ